MLAKNGQKNAVDLADVFCREARMRIDANFNNLFTDHDTAAYRLVSNLLKGDYDWFKGQMVEPVVATSEQVEVAIRKLASNFLVVLPALTYFWLVSVWLMLVAMRGARARY